MVQREALAAIHRDVMAAMRREIKDLRKAVRASSDRLQASGEPVCGGAIHEEADGHANDASTSGLSRGTAKQGDLSASFPSSPGGLRERGARSSSLQPAGQDVPSPYASPTSSRRKGGNDSPAGLVANPLYTTGS